MTNRTTIKIENAFLELVLFYVILWLGIILCAVMGYSPVTAVFIFSV